MYLNITNYLTQMDKNSRFLLIIICIIILLLILIFIVNYIGTREERKKEKNKKRLIKEINKAAKGITETPKTLSPATKNISVSIPKKEEEPKKEVEKQDEIIEILQDDNESDIDRILREIKEASKEEPLNLNEFEKEQEETAIISYDELCKRAGVKKKIYKASNEKIEKQVEKTIKNDESKKYKPSKVVSPIYGVQEEKQAMYEDDLDKTFLQSLKEFRSSLD